MTEDELYARPIDVTDVHDCHFYHTVDLPGHGCLEGEWDLRANIGPYLGGVSFRGKRVLDVGSATGFLTFHMEGQGAEVVSYDLNEEHPWDFVPFAGQDFTPVMGEYRGAIRRINHGYWFCHRVHGSRARKVHGTVYAIPRAIGPVDVSVFGSVLLHVRDPFLALHNACRLTRETVVVTEMLSRRNFYQMFLGFLGRPRMTFLPEYRSHKHGGTWWALSPASVKQFLGVLGFEDTRVNYHRQKYQGQTRLLFTVVGRRTRPPAIFCEADRAMQSAA
jgi:hypothetical protein